MRRSSVHSHVYRSCVWTCGQIVCANIATDTRPSPLRVDLACTCARTRTNTNAQATRTEGHAPLGIVQIQTDMHIRTPTDMHRRTCTGGRSRACARMRSCAWRGVHERARAARVREEGAQTRACTRARTVCIPGCWVVCTPSAGTNRVWFHDIVRECLCTFPFTCLAILNRPAHVCTSIYACVERPSQVQRVRDTQQEPDWGDQASDRVTKVPTQGVEARLNVHAADRPQMLHATDSAGAADVRRQTCCRSR